MEVSKKGGPQVTISLRSHGHILEAFGFGLPLWIGNPHEINRNILRCQSIWEYTKYTFWNIGISTYSEIYSVIPNLTYIPT